MFNHPGGKFLIQVNVGRDISRFFYGGYSLEGNFNQKPPLGHNHSNNAKAIINDLIVAVYDKEILTQATDCELIPHLTHMWNSTTGTIFLKSKDKAVVPNFKGFFPGLDMIGKHFKIRSS